MGRKAYWVSLRQPGRRNITQIFRPGFFFLRGVALLSITCALTDRSTSTYSPILLTTLLLVAVLGSFFWPGDARAAQVTLSWNAPTNYTGGAPIPDFIGFNIHMGTTSGNYSQTIDVGTQTQYTVTNLAEGTAYYFAITAYDSLGNESGYSSEVNNAAQTASTPSSSSIYTISASAGNGGSISPSGSIVVSQNLGQSFTVASNPGYTIADVTVDGSSVGAVTSYTFNKVTTDHTISATFAINNPTSTSVSAAFTLQDVLRALQIATGSIVATTEDLSKYDVAPLVNGKPAPDGKINLADAMVLMQNVIGIVSW